MNVGPYGGKGAKLRAIRDRDHKVIVRLEQELRGAIVAGAGFKRIVEVSHELIRVTKLHFESEELAMGEDNLSSYSAHQDMHAEMLETLEDISGDLEKKSIRGAIELIKFFDTRLSRHLTVEDVAFESEMGG
jgi:hemerythrin-like metal-binding protein